jgi:RHS repeat-associated protein
LRRRTSITFGNGAVQAFAYDPVSRPSQVTNDLSGTTNDLTATFSYNPASQTTQSVRTGDTYAYTAMGNGSTVYAQNGLNQQITIGGSGATWDTKGNLTSEPQNGKTYGYSSENLMTSASGGVTLGYDPAMRLYQVAGAATTRFAYDGVSTIAEYDGSNTLQRRYVFGPGLDAPIVWYEGSDTTARRFMSSDERGSIISLTDNSGALININRYDEYGKPQSTNVGRFQYTGQMWLSEIGAYYYKARIYLPHLGIFAQIDPAGGTNLYAYASNSPVDLLDPFGMDDLNRPPICTGSRIPGNCDPTNGLGGGASGYTIDFGNAGRSPSDHSSSAGAAGGLSMPTSDPWTEACLAGDLFSCLGPVSSLAGISGINGKGYIPKSTDYFLLGATIMGEASGHPSAYAAVGWTIVNRVGDPHYADTLAGVVFQPSQFDAVNNPLFKEAYYDFGLNFDPINSRAFLQTQIVAIDILSGRIPDQTNGSMHFFSGPAITRWEIQMPVFLKIGTGKNAYTFGP